MSRYVAAYDVSEDYKRTKVAEILMQYGDRIQKSVFLIDLETEDFASLQFAVGKHLSRDDEFDVIPVDDAPNRPFLRWQANLEELQPVIVID